MLDCSFLSSRRIELGLSQIDIAKQLGYSVQLISLWESGKNTPSLQILSKYASILKIDLNGIIYSKVSKDNDYSDSLSFDGESFGKNLRHLRKKKKLTQKELANRINCPVNAIIRFEKGTSSPSIPQFLELCKIFDKTVDELYFGITIDKKSKKARKRKFFLPLPILIPIVVAAGGGVVTGTVIGVNEIRKNNNHHPEEVNINTANSSSDIPMNDSSSSELPIDSESSSFYEEPSSSLDSSSSELPVEQSTSDVETSSSELPIDSESSSYEEPSSSLDSSSSEEYISSSSQEDISTSSSSNPTVSEISLGVYPQSVVNDESLITILDGINEPNTRGYYEYDGNEYYKAISNTYPYSDDSGYFFDNGERITKGNEYWFKVEPIKWDVIASDEESYTLFSNIVLEESVYGESNAYDTSTIRSWLNNDFINKAFYGVEEKLIKMHVDNSLASTTDDVNPFVCDDTDDYVTLISVQEVGSVTKTAYSSEYCRAVGGGADVNKKSPYWTRTPSNSGSKYVVTINTKGSYVRNEFFRFIGVRPIIKIKR